MPPSPLEKRIGFSVMYYSKMGWKMETQVPRRNGNASNPLVYGSGGNVSLAFLRQMGMQLQPFRMTWAYIHCVHTVYFGSQLYKKVIHCVHILEISFTSRSSTVFIFWKPVVQESHPLCPYFGIMYGRVRAVVG